MAKVLREILTLFCLWSFTQPTLAATCHSALDCQLNGLCESGACQCDPGWGGLDCGDLQLEPGAVAYGCAPEALTGVKPTCDVTSWGGGPPVWDKKKKQWVLFVVEMAQHCGLSVWQWMSTIVKTTGVSPAGPFTRDSLVIGAESHNAYYVQDPRSGKHLIYHIGTGVNGSKPWDNNCANGTTSAGLQHMSTFPAGATYSPEIHWSRSLDGPWDRLNISGVPAGEMPRGASNPAPFIFDNGTTIALFRVYNATPVHHTSRIFVMRAASFVGPYEVLGEAFHPGGSPTFNSSVSSHVHEEDPTIWRDFRGNFHALCHFTHGHGFSTDAVTWHWADPKVRGRSAWTDSILLPNGTVAEVRDGERPRIWINETSGLPELLFVASGGHRQPTVADGQARGFTLVQKIRARTI